MIKNKEERFSYTDRLEEKINEQGEEIEKLKKMVDNKPEEYHSDIMDEISKSIPLYTRFKVFLQMQHLNMSIKQDQPFTDEEMNAADTWAKDTTLFLLKQLKEWEDDGRPKKKRVIPKIPPEDRSI